MSRTRSLSAKRKCVTRLCCVTHLACSRSRFSPSPSHTLSCVNHCLFTTCPVHATCCVTPPVRITHTHLYTLHTISSHTLTHTHTLFTPYVSHSTRIHCHATVSTPHFVEEAASTHFRVRNVKRRSFHPFLSKATVWTIPERVGRVLKQWNRFEPIFSQVRHIWSHFTAWDSFPLNLTDFEPFPAEMSRVRHFQLQLAELDRL